MCPSWMIIQSSSLQREQMICFGLFMDFRLNVQCCLTICGTCLTRQPFASALATFTFEMSFWQPPSFTSHGHGLSFFFDTSSFPVGDSERFCFGVPSSWTGWCGPDATLHIFEQEVTGKRLEKSRGTERWSGGGRLTNKTYAHATNRRFDICVYNCI